MAGQAYYQRVTHEGKRVLLHRLIAEKSIGRPLAAGEHVHHVDGNRFNNSVDNLKIMSNSEHIRLHRTGCALSEETKRKISDIKKALPRDSLRKLSRTEAIEALRMRDSGATIAELAKYFKISVRALRSLLNGTTYKEVYADYQAKRP